MFFFQQHNNDSIHYCFYLYSMILLLFYRLLNNIYFSPGENDHNTRNKMCPLLRIDWHRLIPRHNRLWIIGIMTCCQQTCTQSEESNSHFCILHCGRFTLYIMCSTGVPHLLFIIIVCTVYTPLSSSGGRKQA